MRLAFPSKRLEVRRQMATQMWDMLGRYGTEPEHFKHILKHHKKYLSIYNDDILERLKGRPYIVITSHSGSMGLLSIPFALHKIPGHIVYKFPGNNLTADITRRTFGQDIGNLKFINNNTAGVREMMAVLRDKGALCIIPDHRLGKGIPTKFFGRSVLSPGGAAKLAGHFDCPILPVQIIRHEGLNHSIIFHEPFHASRGRDGRTDETKTTQRINDVIEGWIRENPEQWFWVHDRFGIKGKVRDAR
ncbi:MAG: hypothetical protein FWD15_00005, partial [Alphaproteobacteria bacterium]|nr:hypothetical protein [Alphaproteobacteria bacterium]